MKSKKSWFLYIIRCSDDSLYTGITTDIPRRLTQHNSKKGAKAVKGKLPVTLAYSEELLDRSAASKREIQVKQLSREDKTILIKKSSLDS